MKKFNKSIKTLNKNKEMFILEIGWRNPK